MHRMTTSTERARLRRIKLALPVPFRQRLSAATAEGAVRQRVARHLAGMGLTAEAVAAMVAAIPAVEISAAAAGHPRWAAITPRGRSCACATAPGVAAAMLPEDAAIAVVVFLG